MAAATDQKTAYELFFSAGERPRKRDGLWWKEIFREGELAFTPTLAGATAKPLRIITQGETDPNKGVIALSDLHEAYEAGVVEHVTVPTSHLDKPEENTGFIDRVEIVDGSNFSDGKARLMAGFRFTDPEIEKKVAEGSIANCSSGIYFDVPRRSDGKRFRAVLKHVALTNKPFMPGLAAFSDDEHVEITHFADVIWNQDSSFTYTLSELSKALGDMRQGDEYLYVKDATSDSALVCDESGSDHWVVPYSRADDGITLAPRDQWQATEQAWIAAADEARSIFLNFIRKPELPKKQAAKSDAPAVTFDDTASGRLKRELAARPTTTAGGDQVPDEKTKIDEALEGLQLSDDGAAALKALFAETTAALDAERQRTAAIEKDLKERRVEDRIKEISSWGFGEPGYSGFLAEIRNVMLNDNGGKALMFSEDGNDVQLTVTEAIDRVLDALPKEDGKVVLSKQIDNGLGFADTVRPPVDTKERLGSVAERAAAAEQELFGDVTHSTKNGGEK